MTIVNPEDFIPAEILGLEKPVDQAVSGYYYSFYWRESIESPKLFSATAYDNIIDVTHLKRSIVAECIYIWTGPNREMKGYVFRRTKMKNGQIDSDEDHYFKSEIFKKVYRFSGHYTLVGTLFFGTWLDPKYPKDVAGTVRLRYRENRRNTMWIGNWDGIDRERPNENSLFGYQYVGGPWKLVRIADDPNEFCKWANELAKNGDSAQMPNTFVDLYRKYEFLP